MWRCHRVLLVVFIVLLGPVFHDTCAGRSASMQVACGTCHTMHNSDANFEVVPGGLGPLPALMNNTCVGCHASDSAGANDGSKPFVFTTVLPSPAYNPGSGATHGTLAGGNFYWVSQGNDLQGHNVEGVVASQSSRTPPGGSKIFDATTPLTCAGVNGCHGDDTIAGQVKSIWGSHHGPTPGTSYRYLNGIIGVEDSDWEYTLIAADDHNQYKGKSRTGDDDLADNESSISHLCAKCHGDFHSGAYPAGVSDASFASPWVRHPVDYDMGKAAAVGSEYADYGEGGVPGAYKFSTPLADINATVALSWVTLDGFGDGTAIITCITCHRAHDSPYDYSLRWDYKQWPGGALDGGCYDCHTIKN